MFRCIVLIAAILVFSHSSPTFGATGLLSASTASLQAGTLIFQGTTGPDGSGDLTAQHLNMDTGAPVGIKWSAAEKLDARNLNIDPRVIFTYRDDTHCGVLFAWDHLSETQKQHLVGDGQEPFGSDVLAYLAGDRSLEDDIHFRIRKSRMGGIRHSRPVFHDNVVYAGANDGMLHAFDARSGEELFAYIPNRVFESLPLLADPDVSEGYFVDSTPFVKEITPASGDTWTALVGGLGKGGKGIYCLDVSDAGSVDASASDAMSLVKWEFSDPDHMGYTTGRPLVVKTRAGHVIITGNGYDSAGGEAVIFVLSDIKSAHPVAFAFHTGAQGNNGIKGDITAIDANSDGYSDFVYAGDLHGNIWKLDIRDTNIYNWDFSYTSPHGPRPFFTARTSSGKPQPVTTAIDVMLHCDDDREGFLLLFGTGDADLDAPSTAANTVYGLWDWQQQWEIIGGTPGAGADKSFGPFSRPGLEGLENYYGDTFGLPEIRNLKLLEQSVQETRKEHEETWVIMTRRMMNWWDPKTGTGDHVGWFFDLPEPGEQIIHNPVFQDGVATVISTAVLYMIDACSGGEPSQTRLDVNRDDKVTGDDTVTDRKGSKRRPAGIQINTRDFFPFILAPFLYLPGPEGDDDFQIIRLRQKRSGVMYWYIPDYNW